MKKLNLLFLLAMIIMVIGCEKDSTDPAGESELATYSTSDWGSFSTDSGFGLQVIAGTVPQNESGEEAQVTFTIETGVDAPKPLEGDGEFIGEMVKYGPNGFNFRWPVELSIPYPEDANPDELFVIYYDQILENWRLIPRSSVDNANRIIKFNSINLGVFSLVTFPDFFRDDYPYDGGFRFSGSGNYYYTLTVAAVSNYKYPYQANWPGNPATGLYASSGSQATTGTPISPMHIYLVQADYQMWISRTTPGTFGTLPQIETYTVPAIGTISNPVKCGQSGSCTGWTSLTMPSGGEWVPGSPEGWPNPTVTYGTGEFQATLTWVNNDYHRTDLDLHLYGPDDMHVYYSDPTADDGSFALDRDWLEGYGNAVENIYSLTSIPSGEYTLKVLFYSGHSTDFQVRIINSGTVKTYNYHLREDIGEMTIETFSK